MKKKLSIVLVVVLTFILLLLGSTSVAYGGPPSPPVHKEECLGMVFYSDGDCGPCAGTSIGQYYRETYEKLPWKYASPLKMSDALHEYMDTDIWGATHPHNFGSGFVEMALHYGYDNFGYEYYGPDSDNGPVDDDLYGDIVDAIDEGWPVALAALNGFDGVGAISTDEDQPPIDWPCTKGHWIAIKGYDYWMRYGEFLTGHIMCTDSWSEADNLELDWYELIDEVDQDDLYAVIIKDEDDTPDGPYVEDFEWGDDEMDLEDNWQEEGGEVDWEVSASGDSVVEIDDDVYYDGTRSARFYTYTSDAQAYYDLIEPSWIDFEFKKDTNANAYFRIGNGHNAIWFRVNTSEQVQYYDGSWHTVYTLLYLPDWYWIVFNDIDWDEGTFDIWVNDIRRADDANMRSYTGYNGIFKISNSADYSAFWIDDIWDSLRWPFEF